MSHLQQVLYFENKFWKANRMTYRSMYKHARVANRNKYSKYSTIAICEQWEKHHLSATTATKAMTVIPSQLLSFKESL